MINERMYRYHMHWVVMGRIGFWRKTLVQMAMSGLITAEDM